MFERALQHLAPAASVVLHAMFFAGPADIRSDFAQTVRREARDEVVFHMAIERATQDGKAWGHLEVLAGLDLPKEGLEVLAHDAVKHPKLRRATHVGSRGIGAKIGVKLHG